ncbi:MAG: S8 family peptidase [Myxococcota bacterium]
MIPNDPLLTHQWSLGLNGINLVEAVKKKPIKTTVAIGIIDTGVDYNHPDLKDNIWTNSLEIPGNNIDDDKNGYIDDIHGIRPLVWSGNPMDDQGHGTQVAGIIGAVANNGIGIAGIVPKIAIVPCKALDAQGKGKLAQSIECLGYFLDLAARSKDPVTFAAIYTSVRLADPRLPSRVVEECLKYGILLVAGAGSGGFDIDKIPGLPDYPIEPNSLIVGATDRFGALAPFSNFGKHSVHVLAPGEDILTTFLSGEYRNLTDASAAAAIVVGMAAYLKANDPTRDYATIKNLILAGGEQTPSASLTTISGRRVRLIDSNGIGALSCHNQIVTRRIQPKTNPVTMKLGTSLRLVFRSHNCAKSVPPLPLALRYVNDIGKDGDVAGDGVYSGYFKPTSAGVYYLPIFADDTLTIKVVL